MSCPSMDVTTCAMPSWMFFLVALNIFLYQTFDNLDGKQARRTGSSSPLGELFDHGCDSLFLLFTIMPMTFALQLSKWEMYSLYTVSLFAFYGAHWEEFFSDHLVLGMIANPTEVQFLIMGTFLFSWIMGPSFWTLPWVGTFRGSDLFRWFFTIGIVGAVISNFMASLQQGRLKQKTFFEIINPILPMVALTFFMGAWAMGPHHTMERHVVLFCSLHGLLFSMLCNQLMTCRVTKMSFEWLNPCLLFPLVGCINAYLSLMDDSLVLVVLFVLFLEEYLRFILTTMDQLTHYLQIRVFSIQTKKS